MAGAKRVRVPRRAVAHLRAADAKLADVIERVGPPRLQVASAENELAALVRAIVYQQLSGKAAATIYGRFRALFEDQEYPGPEEILGVHHMRLRKVGLSRNKQAAIKDLCRHVAEDRLPLANLRGLDDEQLIDRLVEVRGIGRWSAQMFLMFQLGRPDVWPTGDLGIRKAVGLLRGRRALPDPAAVERAGQRYRPFRSVAAWYLWRSLDVDVDL